MLRSRQSDPGREGERPPLDMLDTVDSRQCKFNECLVFRSSVFVHQARHASQRSHSHANNFAGSRGGLPDRTSDGGCVSLAVPGKTVQWRQA